MQKYTIPRLKLGGTSFLLHDEYVPAVRFTAERCEDVALLLMETGAHGEFLISREEIKEIGRIVRGEGATLHVHLPTDAWFDTKQGARAMVDKVKSVVERTAPLSPHSFVLHVDFPDLRGALPNKEPGDGVNERPGPMARKARPGNAALSEERRIRTAEALREIAACLPAPEQLAVENLETFPVDFWDVWLDGTPYSRCLDIGHIWKDNGDPAPVLKAWLPRLRVIHLHGLEPRGPESQKQSPRDHKSLRLMPPERLDAVLHPLWKSGFAGVLNLEVFCFDDFTASHAAIMKSWERYANISI